MTARGLLLVGNAKKVQVGTYGTLYKQKPLYQHTLSDSSTYTEIVREVSDSECFRLELQSDHEGGVMPESRWHT